MAPKAPGDFPKLGIPFGGPHNKDYSILGSILGPPIFGNYHPGFAAVANAEEMRVGTPTRALHCRAGSIKRFATSSIFDKYLPHPTNLNGIPKCEL